ILANKKPYVAAQSVLGEWTNAGYEIPGDIINAINNKEFDLIITDDKNFDLIKNNYLLNGSLPKNKIPIVKDGWMSRNPKYVWLPK
ncbi:MAG: hypothetical protein JKY33_05570, partial [Bacteroidia bacterium]|nr:hypothetical protein [Bacteroidia bacterium]